MIKMFCDICGKDCDLTAYDLTIYVLHNPCPVKKQDVDKPQITSEDTHTRCVLCSECYEKTKLPNPYK